MFILDRSVLMPGDIIFTRRKAVPSKLIRFFTDSDYSHAMLYVSDGSYIHSDLDGVHAGNIQRLLFKNKNDVMVRRVKNTRYIHDAVVHARTEIGKAYSKKEAILTTAKRYPAAKNRQFCSRLVAQSYYRAGLLLVENVDFCTPQDVFSSDRLLKVGRFIRKATVEEIDFCSTRDAPKIQAQRFNKILKNVRRVTKRDLQNQSEITNFVISNVKYDAVVSDIFRKSGYMDEWKYEGLVNNWKYNEVAFSSLFGGDKSELKKMAKSQLATGKELKKRYVSNYSVYNQYAHLGLDYINLHRMLYVNLISQADLMIDVANKILHNFR